MCFIIPSLNCLILPNAAFHTKKSNKICISINRLNQNCIKNITCSKVHISYKLQKDCSFYISLVFLFLLENLRSESQDFNIIDLWEKKCIHWINMELNNNIYFDIF